jgi:hypothetical protein
MKKGPLGTFSFELHARMTEATPTKNQQTWRKKPCHLGRSTHSVKLYIEFRY